MIRYRWRQISAICNAVLALAGVDGEPYLSHACHEDERLRRDIKSLLGQSESFLASPLTLPQGNRLGAYEIVSIFDSSRGGGGPMTETGPGCQIR